MPIQEAHENGDGDAEASGGSIALSLPYTQRAQRELRVSKQQVRRTSHHEHACTCTIVTSNTCCLF